MLAQAAPPPAQQKPFEREPLPKVSSVPEGWIDVRSTISQQKQGSVYKLRGKARLQTSDFLLTADEIDYDEETSEAEARGSVYLKRFEGGEELWADRVEYNISDESGKFYNVRGSAPVQLDARPGLLTSSNPFYFEGKWAERIENRYILHDGFITNCKMPSPWWVLRGPKFDVIPGERALAYRSVLRLRGIPLFYAPVFYKSLEKAPRRSGFLTPNIGNSSQRGKMIGGGYYWAINRSYDLTYRGQYFTERGLAHNIDVRGKPREGTDFDGFLYGVNDRGQLMDNGERRKAAGFVVAVTGRSDLGKGFYGRAEINYLSSMRFRQAFSESFNEAISSEVDSTGFISKDWSSYGLNFVFQRNEMFPDPYREPDDTIVTRKLPEVEFSSRDRQVWHRGLPVWVSLDSSAGLLRRKQPAFQTRQFLERADFEPRIMTALRWKGFNLIPSFSIRDSHWGERQGNGQVLGQNINRNSREFSVALEAPSLARVYDSPGWLGQKFEHVIEPSASFRYVTGVDSFDKLIRFDETDLLANTTEVEFSVVNRLWTKSRDGQVRDWMSWEVRQRRFFDPDFGGALVRGQRNVFLSSTELTAYAFLDQARRYSPVVNSLRAQPLDRLGLEWRGDYDPLRGRFTNSSVTVDTRSETYFLSLGHTKISCVPLVGLDPAQRDTFCADAPSGQLLAPASNQLRATVGLGNENRRGWNAGVYVAYDYATSILQYVNTQITYNTSCCAFSGQYRRFNFGTRSGETQFRVAMVIANIGSFGTLKRQERLF
ncbi:MAG: LPS assembly protein LptD [Acidobacteria bacterium]|nr:LPS assembly protein LptD [Acidobacteriota bacterium]